MNSEKPLISVIVPVYNEERYLRDCVGAIASQNFQSFEIILVDDGSTNSAGKICDELAAENPAIKVVHKVNQGLSTARITGLENASGQWLMFADNDDIISPYMMADMAEHIDVDVDIIAGGRVDIEDVESFVFKPAEKGAFYKKTGPETVERIPADEQRTIVTPMWGKLYRRGFLEGMNLLKYKETCPTIFFEDVLMTPIIYSQARNIVIIENTYYIHREVASSISRSGKLSDFYYEQIYSGEILLAHCREMGLEKMYKHELNIHIKTLLRIWVLIDLYKMADEKRQRLKEDIVKSFEKYKPEYMTLCDDSFVKKQIVKAFGGNRKLWTAVMRKTVYRQDVLVASNI